MEIFLLGFGDTFLDKELRTFLSHPCFISENLELGSIPEGGKQGNFM